MSPANEPQQGPKGERKPAVDPIFQAIISSPDFFESLEAGVADAVAGRGTVLEAGQTLRDLIPPKQPPRE